MIYSLLGIIGFILFYLYEIHIVTGRFCLLKPCFFIGVILILLSTCTAVWVTVATVTINVFKILFFGIFALAFLFLLIYSLFFAVPFSKTYIKSNEIKVKKVCNTGVYALCRHPGVICFFGFYFFIWLSFGGQPLLWQFLIYSALNYIYILIQDNWSFLKCFEDYEDYKKNTPFLIPNKTSIQGCIKSLKSGKGGCTL